MLHRETFLQHYHRPLWPKSKVNIIKAKFGEVLCSKGDLTQMNELLCKVHCHNFCVVIQSMYELGVPLDFGADE